MEGLHALDQGVLYRFEIVNGPWLTAVMKAVTLLGNGEVLGTVATLFLVAFLAAGARRAALCLAGAGLLALVLVKGTQFYVNRPRPDLAWRRLERLPDSPSFPSGHALGSLAVYGTVVLLLARRMRRRWTAVLLAAGVFGLALTIGFSRMFLGVHYPLDVLGGWLGGLGCALLAFWVDGLGTWRPAPVGVGVPSGTGRVAPAGDPEGIERTGDVQLFDPTS